MGYLLGEYGASKTRDGQFVHDVTGLSGPNVERLMSFNSSVQNGTVDTAQVNGIPSVDNDRINYLIGDFGISAVNDMIEAYIAKPGIFCGYLEILNAYSRLSSEPDDDYLYNAALASTTEIAGYEHIPLREYIRFEVDRVTKAFGEYLISKYIGDDEIADRRRRE